MNTKLEKLMLAAALLAVSSAMAEDANVYHWTGAAAEASNTASWTNPGNWQEGVVPGLWRKKTNGVWVTNGCSGCTVVFGKASSRAGSKFVRVQDTGGWNLLGVKNVRFEGADCSAYTFTYYDGWTWGNGNNPLKIEAGGGIYVAPEVTTRQTIEEVMFAVGATGSTTGYIENNGSSPLVIKRVRRPVSGTDVPAGWKTVNLQMQGTGTIQWNNGIDWAYNTDSHWYPVLKMAMSGGKLVLNETLTGLYAITVAAGSGQQEIEIASGKTLGTGYPFHGDYYYTMECNDDLRMTGAGSFSPYSGQSKNFNLLISTNKTWEIACNLVNSASGSYKDEAAGLRLAASVGGVLKVSGANSINGALELDQATFETDTLARLGNGVKVWLSRNGRLRFTGVGAESSKVIRMDGNGAIENRGSGDLLFSRVDATNYGTDVLTVESVAGAAVGFVGSVEAKVKIADGATLALACPDGDDTASIDVASLVTQGTSKIKVGDGVEAVISAFDHGDGSTLDIALEGSATISIASLTAGAAPAWLTVNGHKAYVRDGGSVVGRTAGDDSEIDAHGGVIPDDAGTVVGITTAAGTPSANVTLAADATEVLMLNQREAVDPAVVEIGAAQTLSAAVVSVEPDARPLTLGATAGTGTVAPLEDELVLQVKDAAGRLTVNSAVSLAVSDRIIKAGAGTAELNGGVAGTVEIEEGSVVLNGSNVTAAEFAGKGVFDASVAATGDAAFTVEHGRITMEDGTVTAALGMSSGKAYESAFVLNGGTFTDTDTAFAGLGFRYYGINGGTFVRGSAFRLGYKNEAVMEISGGAVTGAKFNIGYGWRRGVLRITDGSLALTDNIQMPPINESGSGIITLDGPGAMLTFPSDKGIMIGQMDTSHTYANEQFVNLNAGKLSARYLNTFKTYSSTLQKRYVNFNGGTFKYLGYDSPFGTPGSDWEWPVDRVTVFAGGAVIETIGGCSFKVPFQAPTGKGIKSVNWTPVSGLAGSIGVRIVDEGGTGAGASAFAEVDADGNLIGVTVMSPGWNYTSAKVQLVRLGQVSLEAFAEFDCELEDEVSGGLTKTGPGTATLVAVNTYTGPTVVRQGALKLSAADRIAAESKLVLDGGDFNCNGYSQSFSGFDCRSGNVSNGRITLTGLTVDFEAALAGNVDTIDGSFAQYANSAVMTVTGYDRSAVNPANTLWLCRFANATPANLPTPPALDLPAGMTLKVSSAGIRLAPVRATLLLIK